MNANLIRTAWSIFEETPSARSPHLSLSDRLSVVLQELENRITLLPQERQQIERYLMERQHLITELYS